MPQRNNAHKLIRLPVVRTPEKLRNILTTQHSVPASTLDAHLTIHAGDVTNVDAVSKALKSPADQSFLVDIIYFSVGGAPKMQASLKTPITVDQPEICRTGIKTVLSAIDALAASGIHTTVDKRKPLAIAISTIGISDKKNDVPLLMKPLYHYTLHVPHQDKKEMEKTLFQDGGKHIRDFVIIRGALYVDGKPRGIDSVKSGWEWGVKEGEAPGPNVGYTIGRKDLGEWVFRKVIAEGGWEGKCISLSY